MTDNKTLILKTLVGSHAHGLATATSDYDYRGVYVLPTRDILSLGYNYKGSHWLEGDQQDQTAYEIGHFLHLATKCNPTILEVMVAPIIAMPDILNGAILTPEAKFRDGVIEYNNYAIAMRQLLPYCWNPQQAFDAFVGYGLNQRKKMLDNHLDRWHKYGVAYLRTLNNLVDLLNTGTFSLEVKDQCLKVDLIEIRNQNVSPGGIIDLAEVYTEKAKKALAHCTHKPQLDKVNDFLIEVRKEFFQ